MSMSATGPAPWQDEGLTTAPPAPKTPRKNGADLVKIIRSLNDVYELGLEPRDEAWSPQKDAGNLENKVYGQLKRLYYSSDPGFREALGIFDGIASGFLSPKKRLECLHGILKSKLPQTPSSRKVTPVGLQAEQNMLSKSLRQPQFSVQGRSPAPKSPIKTKNGHQDRPGTTHLPITDPGSSTDEDDEVYVTPQSPTLSAAQRRVQASFRFSQEKKATKRPFDGCGATGSSSKLTKTFKDSPPSDWPPASNIDKIPSALVKQNLVDPSTSFLTESVKTSFNTSFHAMSSVQPTRPDTGATSFTSDVYNGDVHYPRLPMKTGSTKGYLDNRDLSHINSRLDGGGNSLLEDNTVSSQQLRESSSTFGSIDESELLNTADHAAQVNSGSGDHPSMPPPQKSRFREGYGHYPWSATNKGSTGHQASNSSVSVKQLQPSTNTGSQPIVGNTTSLFSPKHTKKNRNDEISSDAKSQEVIPWVIKKIPTENLFTENLPKELEDFPYFILFICCRIAKENKVSMRELMNDMSLADAQSGPVAFWRSVNLKVPDCKTRDSHKVWTAAKKDLYLDGFTFKGTIDVNSNPKYPVFRLDLLPIEADRSCRFERKFGSHRFLYLDMLAFDGNKSKPARFAEAQWQQVQNEWKNWLTKEHTFLGRKWRVFHVEQKKKNKSSRRERDFDKRLVMFATEGIGIESVSIGKMLNWFFDFRINQTQSFCKAFARLDLALSRTTPTLTFRPSQIRRVRDKLADGTPEKYNFDDLSLSSVKQRSKKPEIMNDGCSRISVGAALEIWRMYRQATDSKEPLPSIFQGRIGGAKGVWMVCGEPSTTDPRNLAIWIEITDSQLKFEPHLEDEHDGPTNDKHRLTFEHVTHSSRPSPSTLHVSFIPILVDRGVPKDAIEKLAKDRLDMDRKEKLNMLSDPVKVHHWIHQKSPAEEHLVWEAALPKSLPNKLRCLLQSGFAPADEPYVADQLCKYIKMQHLRMEEKLRIPLGRAAFLFGVADPLGVLAPGEVYVDFTEPFVDERTGDTFRALNNLDLLVARHPALRRSDIQKVRAVKKPELAHLVDVVVFSSRGQFPEAGKLQGGDYDGDMFWLCWEPTLAGPFKNAPAPWDPPEPMDYGIGRDTRKLREIMDPEDPSTVDNFLGEAFKFRLMPSLLGWATNFHERRAYQENQIHSSQLDALCDIHDLLVDELKQGYIFEKKDFNILVDNKLKCGNPPNPAYKKAMEEAFEKKLDINEGQSSLGKDYKHKPENILDFLYFEVVRRHNVATLEMVKESFQKEESDDPALRYPCLNLSTFDEIKDAIKTEFASLSAGKFKDLQSKWGSLNRDDNVAFTEVLDYCYSEYRNIVPSTTTIDALKPLLRPYLGSDFNLWEYIRASALYSLFSSQKERQSFVWYMAGRELMKLKCSSIPGSTHIAPNILASMKPKPIKVQKPKEELEDDEEQIEKESQSEWYETIS